MIRIFFWGLIISALGTLPLGTLNVAAMQIAVSESIPRAIWFALGTTLVEVVYVRISLVGMNWIRKQARFLKWLDWIAFVIVLAMAAGSFYAAAQPQEVKNVLLQNSMHRFLLGILMSAINPAQIPFWFGWSAVLFGKKILIPQKNHYNVYITGIGTGSLLGIGLFIFGGRYLVDQLNANQHLLNYVIGSVFLVTAAIQLIKVLQGKGLSAAIAKTGVD